MAEPYKYSGNELSLFEKATNWKKYFSSRIKPFIKGRVLEVGAGIGATTLVLNDGSSKQWMMLEPDNSMADELEIKLKNGVFLNNCLVIKGTLENIDSAEKYDTIIYIDVLEHIERDMDQLINAANHLNPEGHLIVLSPAFKSLFSPFDKAIGHYRRYTKSILKKLTPSALKIISIKYLDSLGYFAGTANRLFLRQSYPSQKQINFWDKWMIPVSKIIDPLFFYSFGKSIIGIWQKKNR